MLRHHHTNSLTTIAVVILTWFIPSLAESQTPLGTRFTFNGRLLQSGAPANGTFDFQVGLFSDLTGTNGQVGSTLILEDVQVTEGLVVLVLDFGVPFDGTVRFLDLAIRPGAETGDFTPLTPRQRLDAVPQSQFSLITAGFDFPINATVNMASSPFQINNDNADGIAITGVANATTGNTIGVFGHTKTNTGGFGVRGLADTTSGDSIGVQGVSLSPAGLGVLGSNVATSGEAVGVLGSTSSPTGIGVKGENNISSPTGSSVGVMGESADGTGVVGFGGFFGLQGQATKTGGTGVFGVGGIRGVEGLGDENGVIGSANNTDGVGVLGLHATATGAGMGVRGTTDSSTDQAIGVQGQATASTGIVIGVEGTSASNDGAGVRGFVSSTSGEVFGVEGSTESPDGVGVIGFNSAITGAAYGIEGQSESFNGVGVIGFANSATGTGTGVEGQADSPDGVGVLGMANSNTGGNVGVWGITNSTTDGWAGFFDGDLEVVGNIIKTAGMFKIDHPLDPANKFLSHSFVESPDMKNIYDGVVELDLGGEATVTLPDWFEALNRDFRYQLTAIGAPGPNLHIAAEIQNNRFRIGGGAAGQRVAWMVTGIRQDAFALANPIQVEEAKSEKQRGSYIHPELFGQPRKASLSRKLKARRTVRGASSLADHSPKISKNPAAKRSTPTRAPK